MVLFIAPFYGTYFYLSLQQKAIQEAYSKWSEKVEFTSDTGASNEDELKIMDEISTILQGNKPE
jgi:hypothetical protein